VDIIEALDGPHEWGYRGLAGEVFIHDPTPNNAAREIQKLRSQVERLTIALKPFAEADWYATGHGKFEGVVTGAALDEAKRIALPSTNSNPPE
jgi:hypothetical protein